MRLEISPPAQADLADIRDYSIAEFGRDVGEAYLQGFETIFEQLRQYPLSGARVPDDKKDRRVFRYRSHQIFYRALPELIQIVRVLHMARDVRRHLN